MLEGFKYLKSLSGFYKLKSLNFLTTPAYDEYGGNTKMEMMLAFETMHLKRINKEDLTEEDFKAADEEKK